MLRRARTSLHLPLATAVVEVTTRGVNKTFWVALVPVQQGIAGWLTHYGRLWGSIPHPPTREATRFPAYEKGRVLTAVVIGVA